MYQTFVVSFSGSSSFCVHFTNNKCIASKNTWMHNKLPSSPVSPLSCICDCMSGSRCTGVRTEPCQVHRCAVIKPWKNNQLFHCCFCLSVRFELFCKLSFIFSLLPASWPSPLFPIVQSALSTRPLGVLLVLCSCSASEVSGISPVIFKAEHSTITSVFSPITRLLHVCVPQQLLVVNLCRSVSFEVDSRLSTLAAFDPVQWNSILIYYYDDSAD